MLIIRQEYLDTYFSSPFTGQMVLMRFLNRDEYPFWFNKLPHLFEENNLIKKYVKLR